SQPASAQLFQALFGGDQAKVEQETPQKGKTSRKDDRKTQASRAAQQPATVAITSNEGELRSTVEPRRGIFGGILGHQPDASLLPQTRALDALLDQRAARKKFVVKPEMEPVVVSFSGYKSGTIVINTSERALYLV